LIFNLSVRATRGGGPNPKAVIAGVYGYYAVAEAPWFIVQLTII
jgi:hypothetical protein